LMKLMILDRLEKTGLKLLVYRLELRIKHSECLKRNYDQIQETMTGRTHSDCESSERSSEGHAG
jgi:hypothetical protein